MAGRAFLRSRGGSLRARMIMEEAEGTSETAAWGKRGVETKKKKEGQMEQKAYHDDIMQRRPRQKGRHAPGGSGSSA